jgi:hypothetical protein
VAAGKTVCRHRGQNVAGSTTGCRKVESGGCEGQNHRLQEFGQMKIPHIYVYVNVYVDVAEDVDVYVSKYYNYIVYIHTNVRTHIRT